MEIEHGEMQKYHYQALSNPLYLMEGQLDCLREELMMNMPVFRESEVKIIPQKIIVKHHYIEVPRPSKKRIGKYD